MPVKVTDNCTIKSGKGKTLTEEDLLGKIEKKQGQVDFSAQTGTRAGRGAKAQAKLDSLLGVAGDAGIEIDPETGLPAGMERRDFTDMSQAEESDAFRDFFFRKGGLSALHQKSAFKQEMLELTQEGIQEKNEAILEDEINPEFDKAAELIQRIEEESLINDEVMGKYRSGVVERVKGLEESRLHRVSAVLGLRGLDPGSPAGAALVARTAEETDAMFAKEMRDLGMQVQGFNTQALANVANMRSGLAMQRITARNQVLKGDEAAMRELQLGFAGFYQALEQQRRMNELAKELQDAGEPSSLEQWGAVLQGAGSIVQGASAAGMFKTGPDKAPQGGPASASPSGGGSSSGGGGAS